MKEMNLNSMGLTELNEKETAETNGGIWGIFVGGLVGILCYAAYEIGRHDAQS